MMLHNAACDDRERRQALGIISMYRVSVSVSEREYQEWLALAEKHEVSMAWLGRKAMQDFLSRSRREQLQLPLSLPRQQKASL